MKNQTHGKTFSVLQYIIIFLKRQLPKRTPTNSRLIWKIN